MEKMTFRQKVENFWYHNKFTTIVVSVFAIFIIIATVQLFTKKEPDANFLYMGPGAVAFSGEALMQESIAEVMKEDYNKDGEKYVDYIELTALDTDKNFDDTEGDFATGYTSAQVQKTVGETFAAHIIAGDSMIYLIDDSFFNVAKETGVLMPLKEALGYTPDIAVNEYAVYLSDLDIYYMPGFNLFPESTMLCIRYPVTLTSGKAEVENRERCNISVFKDMLSYVYPDKPVEIVRPDPIVTSLEDFKIMLKDYSEEKKLSISEDLIDSAQDLTPEGAFEKTGANVFKAGNVTYIVYYEEIYVIGKNIGGNGVTDIEVCNFDGDDKFDFIFTYTYKSGDNTISSASVFDFGAMKEKFLSFESPSPLMLKRINDAKFEMYSFNEDGIYQKHLYTATSDGKDIIIVIKDV
ncbi:MAG: hypothetical protein E7582_05415 [Ruminococcaceae bacterium]|nr:hypothetical protein [Oscillospiraceae bacterium]